MSKLFCIFFKSFTHTLFQVAELSIGLVGCIVGLAFGSMVVIQVLKAIRSMGKK